MKVIYYITEHGLGHSSRSVAIIRELREQNMVVVVRNNDKYGFLKKSLPKTKIVPGEIDFVPVMDAATGMRINDQKTRSQISKWQKRLFDLLDKEQKFLEKEKPAFIISDIAVMPLLAAKKSKIRSVVISSFIWNETLSLDAKTRKSFKQIFEDADLKIKLPFGSPMKLANSTKMGLVSRKIIHSKKHIREKLGISLKNKFVLLSIPGIKQSKIAPNVYVLDISDYAKISQIKNKVNLVEGQDLINAADLVICKCGYGFISEIMSTGTRFRYILDSSHKEASYIHKELLKMGLKNRIPINLSNLRLDEELILNSDFKKMPNENKKVVEKILLFMKK